MKSQGETGALESSSANSNIGVRRTASKKKKTGRPPVFPRTFSTSSHDSIKATAELRGTEFADDIW